MKDGMFRSNLLSKAGVTLKRTTAIINGESSSSSSSLLAPTAKYALLTTQNRNVVISNSRVTASNNNIDDSDSAFVVSYLINSCGLSENKAITASRKLNFKTTTKPDSVLTLLESYGFTQPHISKLIMRNPSILSSNPDKNLKPKFDFLKSKGLHGLDLANFISKDPKILRHSLNKGITPSFDILKSIVQSDQNVIKMIKRSSWIHSMNQVKKVMLNVELLRNEGVPVTNIPKYLIQQPRAFVLDVDSFKEIVEKVKEMGFNHLQTTFLRAIHGLTSMTEANWKLKEDVYKRWGWSEDQIQSAFRKYPSCMVLSEKKIMETMNFLVNEMGYDSLSIAEYPRVLGCSLKERIIPRCYVIRILVSRRLIKEAISLDALSTIVDESFLEKFVNKYKQEVPQLMKAFEGQLNCQELLQN